MSLTKSKSGVRTLATDEVVTANITDNAVTGSKIAALAVNGSKIGVGSDAQGDLLFRDGTQYNRLAAGTSGYFLKTQGAAADPVWAVAPGGVVALRRITGAAATYSFNLSDTDGSTYGAYRSFQLRGWVQPVTDDVTLQALTSQDGTTYDTGASDYKYALYGLLNGTLAGVSSTGAAIVELLGSASAGQAMGNDAHARTQVCIDIEGPEEAAHYATMSVKSSGIEAASNFAHYRTGMVMRATPAVMRGIRLLFQTGNVANGDMTLYGMKNS
tara:strand:+ start:489 stop:1301 length:813 start_codon:yes stop_codon:yes gene_type:complete